MVNSYSDDWKRECLARYIMGMPREVRAEWIVAFKLKRGERAAYELWSLYLAVRAAKGGDEARIGVA